MNFIEY